MIAKPLVAAFLAAGCIGAAAGGAYVAMRQNAADSARSSAPPAATTEPAIATRPVAESEAVVVGSAPSNQPATETPVEAAPVEAAPAPPPQRLAKAAPQTSRQPERSIRRERNATNDERRDVRGGVEAPTPSPASPRLPGDEVSTASSGAPATPRTESAPPSWPAVPEAPPVPPEPRFVRVVVPAASVIGLHVETTVTSERARVEDRVEARVTRDVSADGRVAIPAGSRMLGSVVLVERGGKIKERARLGVRFHTLVFADGSELPIRTDAIYREGESPGGDSARKIGGATVGGAILGAILGGGKGAAIGGAAGAGAGTAAVMAGDRNAATLSAGTVVTVRLAEPVTVDVEKREAER